MNDQAENSELLKVLESGEIGVVGKIKQVLHENLYTAKDASLLSSLIESYCQSKSGNLLGIITGVNESQCQYLFDKMNDLLKRGLQSDVTSLFISIIRQQPSWLYKIVGSNFFTNYLKSLRGEQDVLFMMSGAIIISMLLPCIPSLVAPYLGDILEVFVQMASLIVNKPASLPDILMLHLQIGVYILFHRLYAMYPNNFCTYIRSYFGSRGSDPVFCNVIQPMSQFVKFHPGLILDTLKSETENTKWKTFQPHDVFAECQKISLDPLDAVKEATYTIFSHQGPGLTGITTPRRELVASTSITSVDLEEGGKTDYACRELSSEPLQPKDEQCLNECVTQTETFSFLSNQELSVQWSPSFLCGLSTPPSSRTMSPSNSAQDIPSLSEFAQRPMTPVADHDKEVNLEQQETRTSTPDSGRRKSGGDVKKWVQRARKSPTLSAKSKSDESVDIKTKRPQQDVAKGEVAHGGAKATGEKSKGSPRKRKERIFSSEKSSPRLFRADFIPYSKQTHSAPTTPDVRQKDNFSFSRMQDYKQQEQQGLADCKGKPCALTTNTHHNERPTTTNTTPGSNKFDTSIEELSANMSLLRVIKDLHQDALSKAIAQLSHNVEQSEHLDSGARSRVKSPLELLDEFIECGSNLHSLQLSRIPITSQFDTDWTYFGGTTPADELSILKTQVDLIEVQLQYERYKCDQHVLRNRRLVGKVHKAQAFEDELNGLKSQVSSLECELSEAKHTLKQKDDLNKRLQEFCRTSEDQQKEILEGHSAENNKLRCRVEELMDELASRERELGSVREELKSVQHELFERTSELDHIRRQLELNDAVKAKADYVAKALVTYQEKYDRIKRQFQRFEASYVGNEESIMEIESLRYEIRDHKIEREDLLTSLEAAKARIVDLENLLAKKEISVRDMKSSAEQIHQKHADEVKILEERYKCLKKATQGMESYILYLFKKLEENGRDLRPHNGRRRTGKHDRHEKNVHDSVHAEENSGEYSTKTHQKDRKQVTDIVDENDDRGVGVLPAGHNLEGYRTYDRYERQSSHQEYETHDIYYGSGEAKLPRSWTQSETRSRANDDDKDNHVSDSGIVSSGVV